MKIYKIRLFLLGFLIFSIFILFFVRCYYLFVTQKDFLQNQGDLRAVRVESIPNIRGSILDRNGKYLAVSTIVYDLWLNPYKIHKDKIDIKNLTKQLKTLNIIKPKKLDEWDIYLGRIVDLLNIKKDNRSLGILMECLRNMENRDK